MSTQDIFNAVLAFDEATVTARIQAELDGGTDIFAILNEGLISAMDEVGERFRAGDLLVPEMLKAAKVMKAGLEILKPHLSAGQKVHKPDLHDHGHRQGTRRGDHQSAGQAHDGQHHRRRSTCRQR